MKDREEKRTLEYEQKDPAPSRVYEWKFALLVIALVLVALFVYSMIMSRLDR